MRRWKAALGCAVFFALAPGMVVGVIPWWITGWRVQLHWAAPIRVVGLVLLVAGIAVLVEAFGRFVLEGLGTPSPTTPTNRLVVGGLYRYVRNPMYVAVLAAIVGQALWFGQPVLLGYAVLAWAAVVSFVRVYEEPHLAERYGESYRAYRDAVPGAGEDWISRRVALNRVISVAWQEISCGKHRGGHRVDIHLQGQVMQIWDGDELFRLSCARTRRRSGRSTPRRRAERGTMTHGV